MAQSITWHETGSMSLCISSCLSLSSYKATSMQSWGSTLRTLPSTHHLPKALPRNTIMVASTFFILHHGGQIPTCEFLVDTQTMSKSLQLLRSLQCALDSRGRHWKKLNRRETYADLSRGPSICSMDNGLWESKDRNNKTSRQ